MSAAARGASGAPGPPARLAPDDHKGHAGRVLAICGSRTMPGAAILACRAAQRAGAGIVTLGCLDEELLRVVPPAVPETIYLDASGDADLGDLLEDRGDRARLVGPGLGWNSRTRRVVDALLQDEMGVSLVLDADALNALSGEVERLAVARGPVVLTPHPGEAARLLDRPVPRDEAGRVEAARELAQRSGAIVCLKGAGTVVTDGTQVHVNDTGNPGLATAGSGDVLSGVLVAYLARCGPFEAAAGAVRVHGLAGDLAAERHGQLALVASDIVDQLGAAQLSLRGAGCEPDGSGSTGQLPPGEGVERS